MTATRSEDALALVRSALASFDDAPLSKAVRNCIRIARLRGDWKSVWWFDIETRDLNRAESKRRRAEFSQYFEPGAIDAVHDAIVADYMTGRRIRKLDDDGQLSDEELVISWSIEQIEQQAARMREDKAQAAPPEGLHTLDLYYAEKKYDARRQVLSTMIGQYESVLGQSRIGRAHCVRHALVLTAH